MTTKRSRLRVYGRWGVWVCTAGLLGLLGALLVYDLEVSVYHSKPSGLIAAGMVRFELEDTRLVIEVTDRHIGTSGSDWSVDWSRWPADRTDGVGWHGDSWWWKRPFRFAYGNGIVLHGQGLDLPLVWPAVVMVVWSGWIIRGGRRRRFAAGSCGGCGYSLEGLSGSVCPECGDGAGEDERDC